MISDPAVSEQGLLPWTSQFHEAIVLPSLITQRALTNPWGAGGQPRRLNLTDVRGYQAGGQVSVGQEGDRISCPERV